MNFPCSSVLFWLAPQLVPFYRWLEQNLGFIPLFAGPTSATGRTMLTAGLVPSAALTQAAEYFLQLEGFSAGQVLENKLRSRPGE